jgi:hypothetical protein
MVKMMKKVGDRELAHAGDCGGCALEHLGVE